MSHANFLELQFTPQLRKQSEFPPGQLILEFLEPCFDSGAIRSQFCKLFVMRLHQISQLRIFNLCGNMHCPQTCSDSESQVLQFEPQKQSYDLANLVTILAKPAIE